jgi:hypothetical protein
VFETLTGVLIKVAAFTPLRVGWPHPLCAVTRGIRIIEKPSFNEQNWDFWNLRRTERTEALERRNWLCVEAECHWNERREALSVLSGNLRTAILGFQLWCVEGWDGIIIDAQITDAGTANVESIHIAEPYLMSQWSRMMDLEKLDVAELAPLVEGTLTAFESRAVRAMNPFQFLEIGLQTAFNHVRAGALLWTMGLDALLAAEQQDRFACRLIRLLGKDTLVFPADRLGRRPIYTVGEVAASIYDLRDLIAHGKEILEKYRKPIQFQFEPNELAYVAVEKWTFETLLFESSLFTFIAALWKIVTDGQLELMADKRGWERWLDSPSTPELSS